MLPPIRGYLPPGTTGATRRGAGGRFHLPPATPEAQAAAPTASTGILALQQGWSPAEADEAAQRRGRAILRELEGLQLTLLGGATDPGRLSRLAVLAEGEAGADPVLREILAEITLRARVELARQGP
ncbi:hypothetical protein KTR66_06605 [Roseococcus sp. SDR]|uniref:flagellar assembly protein FliX n=1 Tax=Roseococcus sp. SDR TaxID=2835532 RepID=UPI001BCBCBC2|nr:flagellar assembly protein FliX [Roseococcus sp. SDR]MBS7789655.1 hypothetical protein [Roseococcus sp. SDR]MBV1844969.1 hypothetical protein [Roseococcus sp. SDR]